MKQFSARCSPVPFAPPPGRLVWGNPAKPPSVESYSGRSGGAMIRRKSRRLAGLEPAERPVPRPRGVWSAARPAPDGDPSPCDRPWNRPRPGGGGGVSLAGSGRGRRRRRAGGEGARRRGEGPSPARDGPPEKIRRTLNFAIDSPGRLRYKPRHTGRASPLARDDDQSVGGAATQTRRLVILKRWAHSSVGRAADS
jgi:hypothetical protein